MQLEAISLTEPSSSLTYRTNSYFIGRHRPDLGVLERVNIGLVAAFGNKYGRITRLSHRYCVSRKTIYAYQARVKAGLYGAFSPFSADVVDKSALREAAILQILYLRLIGRCCLLGISTILKRMAYSHCSVGFISQRLTAIGEKLPQVIDYQGYVNWACDEIYHLGHIPILVTVDPISGAILKITIATEGLKEAWLKHWQALNAVGIYCLTSLMDEGWQMRAARLEHFKDPAVAGDFQPDSFHAVSHRLGIFDKRLEKAAYKAIEAEYDRETLCQNTKKPKKLPKIEEQLVMRQAETQKAVAQYDQFSFLYRHLLLQLTSFDRNGQPRNRKIAQSEAQCAVELMKTLDVPGLNKELEMIEKIIPELFNFLDKTAAICQHIIADGFIQAEYLPFWAKAWAYEKKAYKIKNNYKYQQNLRKKAQNWLEWLKKEAVSTGITDQAFEALKTIIFTRLEGIVQSSAAVEMVNSILRPYLNQSRDQISQPYLNLIMDYYNHRPFERGKRKGKAPIEILTGKKQNGDWFDKISQILTLNDI